MMRSIIKPVLPALAALTLAGCAFGDGEPWGEARMRLEARFAPPPERLTPEGRLLTAQSYAIEFTQLRLSVSALRMAYQPEGGGGGDETASAGFDPAAPPPGYTICHNGHCDAADGSLVPYEEVAARLAAQGGGGGGPALVQPVTESPKLNGEYQEFTLGECPDGCELPRGRVSRIGVNLTGFSIEGRAFDAVPGAGRLPKGGAAFKAVFVLGSEAGAGVAGEMDRGEPAVIAATARFDVPATLFDTLDWGAALAPGAPGLNADAAFVEALTSALANPENLTVEVSRQD